MFHLKSAWTLKEMFRTMILRRALELQFKGKRPIG
jgi:hypothetical protein